MIQFPSYWILTEIELIWHLILRQSLWLSCSTLLPSSFLLRESITHSVISTDFFIDLFEFPSCFWPLAHCSDPSVCFLTPSALRLSLSLVCFPLAACPSLSIFCFSLCLLRAQVSAPQHQSVGHSGADQSISGTGLFRGEGINPVSFRDTPSSWKIVVQARCCNDAGMKVFIFYHIFEW